MLMILLFLPTFSLVEAQNCFDFEGYDCVNNWQCDKEGFIITDGSGNIDFRSLATASHRAAIESTCEGEDFVCCKIPINHNLESGPRCGKRNPNGLPGVSPPTGNGAHFGEYPHNCALLKRFVVAGDKVLQFHECGASLLSPTVALTAAHCFTSDKDAREHEEVVRCGEWDVSSDLEPSRHQDRVVARMVLHPGYTNPSNVHNDFALLFLEDQFFLADHISPICLPPPDLPFTGLECVATGWGKKFFEEDAGKTRILKEIKQTLISDEDCEKELSMSKLGQYFLLHSSFVCAVGDEDTCKGDGGSPLTCSYRGKDTEGLYLIGLVSWGIGCGKGTPAVYADVRTASCWIDSVVSCADPSRSSPSPPSFFDLNSHCPKVDCNSVKY